MPFTDFYNITLEHIDFMEEYRTWQSYGNSSRSDQGTGGRGGGGWFRKTLWFRISHT